MKTIAFFGNANPNRYPFNWSFDAVELGYKAQLNTLEGLTKNDIIVIDKIHQFDFSISPAKKILVFPDLIRTETIEDRYLNSRAVMLYQMSKKIDIIAMPPNMGSISYARKICNKPVFPLTFGVYRKYFSFFPKKFPKKYHDLGYCWTGGSERRETIAEQLNAKQISVFGKEMFVELAKCRYGLNAHFSPLLNNEQRITEIPLACAIPVSEPLASPEMFSDIHWIPISEYNPHALSRKEYMEIIKHNIQAVRTKYNSLESLRMLLSFLKE
jgi:hypothetical protein